MGWGNNLMTCISEFVASYVLYLIISGCKIENAVLCNDIPNYIMCDIRMHIDTRDIRKSKQTDYCYNVIKKPRYLSVSLQVFSEYCHSFICIPVKWILGDLQSQNIIIETTYKQMILHNWSLILMTAVRFLILTVLWQSQFLLPS